MKKLLNIFAAVLVAVVANAAVINLTPISPEAENNVRHALANAQDGDTIVLADGLYTEHSDYLNFTKQVVLMAAKGANPVIQTQCCLRFYEATKAKIQGIKFDASQFGSYDHFAYVKDASAISIELEGCEFYNNRNDVTVFHIQPANHIDSIKINNCYFHDNGRSCLFFEASSVADQLTCDKTVITNSTFARIGFNSGYYASVIDIRNGGNQSPLGTVIVDHCTFVDAKALNTDHAPIRVHKSTDVLVSNSLFSWTETYDKRATYLYGGNVKNCIVYNTTKDTQYWGHHSGPTFTDCSMADPMFRDAENGDYHLSDASPAMTAAEDSGAIGDPRWIPQMEYYLVGTMNEWKPQEAYKLSVTPDNEDIYMLKLTMLNADSFKIVRSDGVVISTRYPDGEDNNYVITASGDYTVYFRPDGQGSSDWHGGYFFAQPADLGPWEAFFHDDQQLPDWDSYISYNENMGKVTAYIRQDKNVQWNAILRFQGVPAEDDKCYSVALKMKANHDIAGVTLKWQDNNDDLTPIYEDKSISLAADNEFIYYALVPGQAGNGVLALDFGFAKSGDIIEIYDVAINQEDCPEPPTYYLVGTMNEWSIDTAYTFVENLVEPGEFMLETTLAIGDEIKVVGISEEEETYFPGGIAAPYVVDAAHAGETTVYFCPAGNPDWAAFGGYIFIPDNGQGINQVSQEPTATTRKLFIDGQLLIEKNGRTYTTTGVQVK